MKDHIWIYAFGVAFILCLVGLVLSAMAYSKLEDRVWGLEYQNIRMRESIKELKAPLPTHKAKLPAFVKHRDLIEYSEPAMTR